MEQSAYCYELTFPSGQPSKILWLKPYQLRCMVNETFRQPKPGTRGPKPIRWEVAAKRIERMLMARDALRRSGDPVTKKAILDYLGLRGDKTTIDTWLRAARLRWDEFLAL
jgi:hypothetical protein